LSNFELKIRILTEKIQENLTILELFAASELSATSVESLYRAADISGAQF
jgi:hypothetical protein